MGAVVAPHPAASALGSGKVRKFSADDHPQRVHSEERATYLHRHGERLPLPRLAAHDACSVSYQRYCLGVHIGSQAGFEGGKPEYGLGNLRQQRRLSVSLWRSTRRRYECVALPHRLPGNSRLWTPFAKCSWYRMHRSTVACSCKCSDSPGSHAEAHGCMHQRPRTPGAAPTCVGDVPLVPVQWGYCPGLRAQFALHGTVCPFSGSVATGVSAGVEAAMPVPIQRLLGSDGPPNGQGRPLGTRQFFFALRTA